MVDVPNLLPARKYIPKPPPKAYHAFQRDLKNQGSFKDGDGQKFTAWCGQKWKTLDKAEKEKYTQQEKIDKERYQDEMKELGVMFPIDGKVEINEKVLQAILGNDKELVEMEKDAEYLFNKATEYFIGWFHNRVYSVAHHEKRKTLGPPEVGKALRSSNELRFLQVLNHDSTPQQAKRGSRKSSSSVSKTPTKKLKHSHAISSKVSSTLSSVSSKGSSVQEAESHPQTLAAREQLQGKP